MAGVAHCESTSTIEVDWNEIPCFRIRRISVLSNRSRTGHGAAQYVKVQAKIPAAKVAKTKLHTPRPARAPMTATTWYREMPTPSDHAIGLKFNTRSS